MALPLNLTGVGTSSILWEKSMQQNGMIRHLVDEKSDTFISYINNYRYDLNDGMVILWMCRTGWWRHLYRIDGKTERSRIKSHVENG